jgi:hypothetical protein
MARRPIIARTTNGSPPHDRTLPVGAEYRGLWLDLGVLGWPFASCCELIFAGEPGEDGSAADLVVGEVDRLWGMGLSLNRCEFPSVRCGRAVLKWCRYVARIRRRWCSLTIRFLSSSSRRRVPIIRS